MEPSKAKEPPPRLLRSLWVLTHSPDAKLTAGIYQHPFGHELRVFYGDDEQHVVNAYVSADGDSILLARADALRELLEQRGWVAPAAG